MVLLDSNIFIYLASGSLNTTLIAEENIGYASVTQIETLGYNGLTMPELMRLEAVFAAAQRLDLSERVIERAVQLRQWYSLKLGDSIIAATALVYDLELWTNDMRDFKAIDGLRLHNPYEK